MIEIRCAAAETAKMLCTANDVSATHVWEMCERESRLGWSAARAAGEEAVIVFLQADDASLTDALLRAVLNALRAQGVRTVQIDDTALRRFMERKGYFAQTAEYAVKISDFFAKSTCNA